MIAGLLKEKVFTPLIHLFYPHLCSGCGSDLLEDDAFICYKCFSILPHTGYADLYNNPIEKKFWGRVNCKSATAELYFVKDSIVQNIIYEMKYKNNQALGVYLGEMMGTTLKKSDRFNDIDFIIPLPLYKNKEKERGYNQAELLARGISKQINVPVLNKNVVRILSTETQTKKQRSERWENVNNKFMVKEPDILKGKHVLLIDDVLTTGATLDACATAILETEDVTVSIAVLAVVSS